MLTPKETLNKAPFIWEVNQCFATVGGILPTGKNCEIIRL
jgi:hypothetical protein